MNTFFLAENLPYTFCPVESFAKAKPGKPSIKVKGAKKKATVR